MIVLRWIVFDHLSDRYPKLGPVAQLVRAHA